MRGGGTSIYVSDNLSCRELKISVRPVQKVCEFCVAEVCFNSGTYVILNLYRPPKGDLNIFTDTITMLMDEIYHNNKDFVVCGDFNVHFDVEGGSANDLISLFATYNLYQNIKGLTRVTSSGGSQLDNIFSSLDSDEISGNIIDDGIADHAALTLNINAVPMSNERINVVKRHFKRDDIKTFRNYIGHEDWYDVYSSSDPNDKHAVFERIFRHYFELCFPLRKTTKKTINTEKRWVTPEIRERAQNLRDTYALYKRTGCLEVHKLYKQEKRVYTKFINEQKKKTI